jgi:TRAP-type transport system small permease protein
VKVTENISRWVGYFGIITVLALMLLIIANVIGRVFFNSPITGTIELVSLTMVGLGLNMAITALRGRHITAEIVSKRFPEPIQSIVDSLMILGALTIYAIFAWRAILEIIYQYQSKYMVSIVLPIPMYLPWFIYSVGFVLLCLAIITLLAKKIKGAFRK